MNGIGRVFTPENWAEWLIDRSGALDAWCGGASICDPTFGEGAFIEALISLARRKSIEISDSMIARLYGADIDVSGREVLIGLCKEKHGIVLKEDNFKQVDALSPDFNKKFQFLIGNPPWVNFADLPSELKSYYGNRFVAFDLVKSRKDVLLGSSRADLSTLITKKVLEENLADGGIAAFFLPLSLFFNDGANDRFRPFPGSKHVYRVDKLWDFGKEKIFAEVSTRYGAAIFRRQPGQVWPVELDVMESGEWCRYNCAATDGRQGFWRRTSGEGEPAAGVPAIPILASQRPRQGVNSCGATDILVLTKSGNQYENGLGELFPLEDDLVFPLLNKSALRHGKLDKDRYVILPHCRKTGKPILKNELDKYPDVSRYLHRHRERLMSRKGTLIQSHVRRGQWWTLLGVGAYSFAPWKVAWEALGQSTFTPRVVPGDWQGNQALHAFCPCFTRAEAEALAARLTDPGVERFLRSSSMGGTMNWAQPGRVSKALTVHEEQGTLAL